MSYLRDWIAERWKLNEIKLNRDPVKIQLWFYLGTGIALIFINLWDSSHYHPCTRIHSHTIPVCVEVGWRRTMEWWPILIGSAQHQCSQQMDATRSIAFHSIFSVPDYKWRANGFNNYRSCHLHVKFALVIGRSSLNNLMISLARRCSVSMSEWSREFLYEQEIETFTTFIAVIEWEYYDNSFIVYACLYKIQLPLRVHNIVAKLCFLGLSLSLFYLAN